MLNWRMPRQVCFFMKILKKMYFIAILDQFLVCFSFKFMHLADAFIQSDLHSYTRSAGSVRGSCQRTPAGGRTFSWGGSRWDLNPRSPTWKAAILPLHYPTTFACFMSWRSVMVLFNERYDLYTCWDSFVLAAFDDGTKSQCFSRVAEQVN